MQVVNQGVGVLIAIVLAAKAACTGKPATAKIFVFDEGDGFGFARAIAVDAAI